MTILNLQRSIALGVIAGALFLTQPTLGGTAMLTIGTQAPDFALLADSGDTVKLSDFRGKHHVVLIFYPGDQTPGCTKQLCSIRDDYAQFREKGAVVFGVNPADAKSHRAFAEKQHYQFPLLVDKDKVVVEKYGAGGMMVQRTVYVIDKEGKIAFAQRGMPSNATILAAIKGEER